MLQDSIMATAAAGATMGGCSSWWYNGARTATVVGARAAARVAAGVSTTAATAGCIATAVAAAAMATAGYLYIDDSRWRYNGSISKLWLQWR